MVEALRARRPGACGHVYSVYGPELVEYAEVLLGEQHGAETAVRSAPLMLKDRPELVPSPDAFQDWLYGLVRHRCRESQGRGRRRLAVVGVATGVALATGMLMLFEVTYGQSVSAPPMALTTPVVPTRPSTPEPVPTTAEPAPDPAPTPTRTQRVDDPAPKPKPHSSPPHRHKVATAARGRLAVDDIDCQAFHVVALPSTCHLRLTARGGPVHWSVASVSSVNGRVDTGGGGALKPGESASVPVTVRPTLLCHLGGNVTGTVSFAPGGDTTIIYTCLGL